MYGEHKGKTPSAVEHTNTALARSPVGLTVTCTSDCATHSWTGRLFVVHTWNAVLRAGSPSLSRAAALGAHSERAHARDAHAALAARAGARCPLRRRMWQRCRCGGCRNHARRPHTCIGRRVAMPESCRLRALPAGAPTLASICWSCDSINNQTSTDAEGSMDQAVLDVSFRFDWRSNLERVLYTVTVWTPYA